MYKKTLISIVFLLIIAVLTAQNFNLDDFLAPAPPADFNVATQKIINKLPTAKFSKTGRVKLSDGDSLQFGNRQNRARLFGIDSPELAQKCQRNGKSWACGKAAKNALKTKIGGRIITCIGDERDRYERLIATCYLHVNNAQSYLNLNAWMVKNGWAVAYSYYSNRYENEQAFAQKAKLGIWQSKFLEPYEWRQNNARN